MLQAVSKLLTLGSFISLHKHTLQATLVLVDPKEAHGTSGVLCPERGRLRTLLLIIHLLAVLLSA